MYLSLFTTIILFQYIGFLGLFGVGLFGFGAGLGTILFSKIKLKRREKDVGEKNIMLLENNLTNSQKIISKSLKQEDFTKILEKTKKQ